MRKRLIAIPLMCGALLSLAACGNYAIPDSYSYSIVCFLYSEGRLFIPSVFENEEHFFH